MKKEDLGSEDPQSLDNRRLAAIARNPNHPMHTHARSELDRRKVKRKEFGEAKDTNEYDNEGSMMKSQMTQITSAIDKLMGMIKDDENLPEWVQSKMTKATDYVRSVRDYLESEKMMEAHGGQHMSTGRKMTDSEIDKRKDIKKGLMKSKSDFKKRYGDDADQVMNALATKKAMEGTLKTFKEISVGKLSNYMRMYLIHI